MKDTALNLLTFDIEDWYHPNLTDPDLLRDVELEDRVVEPTLRILKILEESSNKATFFVIGDVAEKFPELLQEMIHQGHEVASHGYRHDLVYNYTRDQFETDLGRSVELLEQVSGRKVLGYRAPSWSLSKENTPWAWDVMHSFGLQYDSSLYPYRTFLYGSNRNPRFEYQIDLHDSAGALQEIPPSAAEFVGKRFPFSGGFFLRVLPLPVVRTGIRQYIRQGHPAVLYLHPWEIDVDQPRLDVARKERFILYANIARTEEKLRKLVSSYRFTCIRDYYGLVDELAVSEIRENSTQETVG